jgi:hypothetical protein
MRRATSVLAALVALLCMTGGPGRAQDKKPDATIELSEGQVAVGIGWSWGSRPAARRLDVRVQLGGLQPGADSHSHGAGRMSESAHRRRAPASAVASSWLPSMTLSPAFFAAC